MSVFSQAGESASQMKVMLPRAGRNLYCKETCVGMYSQVIANGIELHCSGGSVKERGRSLKAPVSSTCCSTML